MARRQSVVTASVPLAADVDAARLDQLKRRLVELGEDVRRGEIEFERLTSAHFARFVVLDPPRGGSGPTRLVFSSVYDGPLDEHLREWLEVAGPVWDEIFAHCAGYPSAGRNRPHAVVEYIRRHQLDHAAFFRGHPDRTLAQVRGERALRAVLDRQIDGLSGLAPAALRTALRRVIGDRADLCWTLTAPARARLAPLRRRDVPAFALLLGVLAAVVYAAEALVSLQYARGLPLAVGLAALAAGAVALVRRTELREARQPAATPPLDLSHRRELVQREDRIVQNQMTHVVEIKPGWVRRVLLPVVLWGVDVRARYIDTKGRLGGIPSIHFAHWVMIDGGRRVVFLSNYDGSWESYLGDFIDYAAEGLTAIWSNGVGFPPSRFLFWDGARRERAFKDWTRAQQVPTQLWYSWYRDLSVENVNRHSTVRRGLAGAADRPPDEAWLRELLA